LVPGEDWLAGGFARSVALAPRRSRRDLLGVLPGAEEILYMRFIGTLALASVSLAAIATPALAQDEPTNVPVNEDDATAGSSNEEIVVQARRRDESQQDVPLVVNAVTAESIEKLNIREFRDIQNLVPGLSLNVSANGIGAQASLRGVNFDVNASGNNGTIEFYLNDAPLSAGILFQSMFDVGQIEVLRGPQGTLRGRASPSGSITVTTRRPDLDEVGGYVQSSLNTWGNWNVNGAINVPVIENVLAVRIGGVVDENEGNRVKSINNPADPYVKTQGLRVSVAAEPFDFLSLFGAYTHSERKALQFDQVESANIADPAQPASPRLIRAKDRLAVEFLPRTYTQNFAVFNWAGQLRFAGQKLDYVGSHNKQHYLSVAPNDIGAFFGPTYPESLRNANQFTDSNGKQTTHELRLSNQERVAGMFDYVVGGLWNKLESPTSLIQQTPLFAGIRLPQNVFPTFVTTGGVTPAGQALGVGLAQIVNTPVVRDGETLEKSLFGNVTAHIGDAFEVSAGARYIHYHSEGSLAIGGVPVAAANENRTTDTWIYSASAKYQVTPNLMAYASFGSSWRPGSGTNPIILREIAVPSARLASLYFPADEKSKSYEVGFKSDWLNNTLRLNVTAFHQDFKNYAYSARNVFLSGQDASGATRVFQANPAIAVGVPAEVNGVEAEIGYRPSRQWNLATTLSYAKSKIKNANVPCNIYGGRVPTVAEIPQGVALCNVNFRAGSLPPFSATVQSEYLQPITPNVDGYLRGLLNFQGNSQNDPSNPFDDVKSYGLLNLYAGIRDPNGAWEIGAFAKNVFDVFRRVGVDPAPQNVSYQQLFCTTRDPRLAGICAPVLPAGVDTLTFGQSGVSTYRGIQTTLPREIGVTFRMAFGSR
jgi:iron complex outermembrane recepter protein